MKILANCSLADRNFFCVSANARWWIGYQSIADLDLLSRDEYFHSLEFICLGSGSNVLFLQDYPGVILQSEISSIEELPSDKTDEVLLRVGSGLTWDELVNYSLERGYYGLENLAGIPGTVGASAVQNIGAYGAEAGQYIYEVDCYHLDTGQMEHISQEQCLFDYRSSIFKQPNYQRSTIAFVTYRLHRTPKVNLTYRALSDFFIQKGIKTTPTPKEVRDAVLEIRNSKLPDPKKYPNAGSFFKNPIVTRKKLEELQQLYPTIPYYPILGKCESAKLSAAWLIEQASWKGKQVGDVGCYHQQPLVIVNYGTQKGNDIANFAKEVQLSVNKKFGVTLEPEVRYIK